VASVIFFLQFSFETVYKKAEDMQVPDALSMCENVKADIVESPVHNTSSSELLNPTQEYVHTNVYKQ
jgi:hypothetical protein